MKNSKKRRKSSEYIPSDTETKLEELLFGKDIVHASKARQEDTADISINLDRNPTILSAWHDEDDDVIDVDLNSKNRLRKLKNKAPTESSVVSGNVMSTLLHDRFQTQPLEWAKISADESNSAEGKHLDILRKTDSLLETSTSTSGQTLKPSIIDISRVVDGNADSPASRAISAVRFHAASGLLMTASEDTYLKFFQIDGVLNEKQLAVNFHGMAIQQACFLSQKSSEVVVSGRRPFFHTYDMGSGSVTRIPGPSHRDMKSFENLNVSTEGSFIAVAGAGGYTHLFCGRNKTWVMDLKMNCAVKVTEFLDEKTVATSGVDADVYVWDLRYTGTCLKRFHHEDGSTSSAIAASKPLPMSNTQYLSIAGQSGVVSVYKSDFRSSTQQPELLKSVFNLRHSINCLAMHPSAQVMAMSSAEKNNQVKLVHLPSCSVYSNWPTERTPLRHVRCMEFSPGGGYLAMGNDKGRVLLYRLNHFHDM